MKLEDQVCALDQAKRLKELGVKQDSFCVWTDFDLYVKRFLHFAKKSDGKQDIGKYPEDAAAFTAAELGEMLGSECYTMLEPGIEMHVWHCGNDDYEVLFPADTEAQAKADLLIWMLEKGHRTAAEVNAALSPAS